MMEQPPLAPIQFTCSECGDLLTVAAEMAGISGPCPACGGLITAPSRIPPARTPVLEIRNLNGLAAPRFGKSSMSEIASHRPQKRVSADAAIDQVHLEQREISKSLRIIMLFILVFCVGLAVLWFFQGRLTP
jgi:hypothetical protein